MTERLPAETIPGDSIRVLTTHICQERCFFCHNEGANDYTNTPIDIDETVTFSIRARQEFGLSVVHLTGGEPTLHPQIGELVKALKNEDFKVQMTTNGDSAPQLLDDIVNSGIDSINFSLHAITPQDFHATQVQGGLNSNPEYYDFLMKRKISNINRARKSVRVKLNTVVINKDITGRVVDFATNSKIPIRLMRNLNKVEESERIIAELLSDRGLSAIKKQHASGDGGGSGTMYGFADGGSVGTDIKVKKFGEVYLSSICEECPLKNTPRCRERFYGIRIGVNPGTLKSEARLCIDRNDEGVVVGASDIFEGKHYRALKRNYGGRKK